MRLANVSWNGTSGIARFAGDNALEFVETCDGTTIDDWLSGAVTSDQLEALFVDASSVSIDDVTFAAPVKRPGKILCIGLNYRDHTAESPYEQPDYPTVFTRVTTSLCSHNSPLVRPDVSDSFDFEGEMAVIIGKAGRFISRAEALSHVAGYSIFNDGSVREYQFKSPQWTVGKNFDQTGAFGPFLVTPDELPQGGAGLQLTTRLNGQVVQSASTDDMIFPVDELIAILSEAMTLEPGDVIVSGTPAGIGWARQPRLLMQDGDVCEVEIEGIGTLSNRISQPALAARGVA